MIPKNEINLEGKCKEIGKIDNFLAQQYLIEYSMKNKGIRVIGTDGYFKYQALILIKLFVLFSVLNLSYHFIF